MIRRPPRSTRTDSLLPFTTLIRSEHGRARVWAATPYGHPVVSDSEKTDGIAVQDIRDFYDTWYAPNNALLIASGRIDPRDLMERAAKHFGKIPKRSEERREGKECVSTCRSRGLTDH